MTPTPAREELQTRLKNAQEKAQTLLVRDTTGVVRIEIGRVLEDLTIVKDVLSNPGRVDETSASAERLLSLCERMLSLLDLPA
jgi:hypothetical protein